ncbi:MAG: DUF1349 domain-containing protein [Chitinivibrionales bacterium]|nr:DUF1349 domain-containing protein [Chitinivibrionales bacterium]MBD3397071.1 DUF1349 domain-containing protein [Chitinivibrionales bacterium]
MSSYGDARRQDLTVPGTDVLPANWQKTINSGLERLYAVDINDDGSRTIAANGSILYLLGNNGNVLWQKSYAGRIFHAVFSADQSLVYVAANFTDRRPDYDDARIVCYDLSGGEQWQFPARQRIFDLKTGYGDNGLLYLGWGGSSVTDVYAERLDADGESVWQTDMAWSPSEGWCAPDGGALLVEAGRARRIDAGGTPTRQYSRDGKLSTCAAIDATGDRIAHAGENVVLYNGGSETGRTYCGRAVRKLAFSPDGARVAAGSCDGIFSLLSTDGAIAWQKKNKSSYITDIAFLPGGGVAFMREIFAYTTSTCWRFRDQIEAYGLSGDLLWLHQGPWRTQPFMGMFRVSGDGNRMIVGLDDQLRYVDLSAAPVANAPIFAGGVSGGLPEGWASADVGYLVVEGGASHLSLENAFAVFGAGSRIGGKSDAVHFLYTDVFGDADIIARVVSAQRVDSYSAAGLMIRENLDADAKMACASFPPAQPSMNAAFRTGTGQDAAVEWHGGTGQRTTVWIRLERAGDKLTASMSDDGSSWTEMASRTVSMNDDVLAGMYVASNSSSSLAQAVFDNVSINGDAVLNVGEKSGKLQRPAWVAKVSSTNGALQFILPPAGGTAGITVWNLAGRRIFCHDETLGRKTCQRIRTGTVGAGCYIWEVELGDPQRRTIGRQHGKTLHVR